MKITYSTSDDFQGWEAASPFIESLIDEHQCKRILEVGSGANPTLSSMYVRNKGITYVTSDLYLEELEKADPAFDRLVLNLSDRRIDPELFETFDLVLSRMVREHIQDGEQFYKNIYALLQPGGLSVHLLAALGNLPATANRFMPVWLSDLLLKTFHPREDEHQHGKLRPTTAGAAVQPVK